MICVRISGGLGNQMFQYALGRKVSLERKEKLIVNISSYENYSLFNYGLNCYNVSCEVSRHQLFYNNKYFRKVVKTLAVLGIKKYYKYYIEKSLFVFDQSVLNSKASVFLGSWQSYKYFKDIKDVIIKDFTLKTSLNQRCRQMIQLMSESDSISLHIRRGDYFSDKRSKKDHGILGLNYFKRALQFATKKTHNPVLFIFSDDIDWVKDNFRTEISTRYIDKSFGTPEISIHMMTKCKHNIISNSSFSWWGAWLNPNPDKIVVAPKLWFRNSPTSKDLVPEDWYIL